MTDWINEFCLLHVIMSWISLFLCGAGDSGSSRKIRYFNAEPVPCYGAFALLPWHPVDLRCFHFLHFALWLWTFCILTGTLLMRSLGSWISHCSVTLCGSFINAPFSDSEWPIVKTVWIRAKLYTSSHGWCTTIGESEKLYRVRTVFVRRLSFQKIVFNFARDYF